MERHKRASVKWIVVALSISLACVSDDVESDTSSDATSRRPNLLLLMADQFRGDALGCDGNPAARTPNLDRLARDGAHFRRAYSSVPSCTPARAGLLTGTGSSGVCDGAFNQDFNSFWSTAALSKLPALGQLVSLQLWFRDPLNTSNQTTSLSDALQFTVCP